jgi:predicted phage baseplate assembly protein
VPQLGSALYLGFEPPNGPVQERIFPQQMRFRVFQSAASRVSGGPPPAPPQSCREAETPPAPPVELEWEYRPAADPTSWRRLSVYDDQSVAFTRDGDILVAGPAEIARTQEGNKIPEERYWLRVRLASRLYPAGRAPQIDCIRPNTVPAENLTTVREEIVGESQGTPKQTFALAQRPVVRDSLQLHVEVPNEEPEERERPWERVDDFFASGRDDRHYVLNANRGEIRFGDGLRGRIPAAGGEIIARVYRYGGGKAGNVPSGQITQTMSPLTGIDSVTNERPAVGGRDEQGEEELKEQAPAILRGRRRAVTAEDYTVLATEAGGVARARALALSHPDFPGVNVPGAVTVVIVPDTDDKPPSPSADQMRQVCLYLDRFRLLTTELYVRGPEYIPIGVEARIAARAYEAFDTVKLKVEEALNDYLSPLRRKVEGGRTSFAGWEFGQDLHPTSLYGVIQGVKGVASVESLTVYIRGNPHDSNLKPIPLLPAQLVYGAGHQITVSPERDR